MSSLIALSGRGLSAFSRDMRFAAAEAAPNGMGEAPPDPVAMAFAEGHAAGIAQARGESEAAEIAAATGRGLLNFSFARLDAELAEQLRDKLHETVVALCETTLQPLALDPKALARRVETAVSMFVRADDERVIRLHPDDLTLVVSQLPADWTFVADPALERGALRVETANGGMEDGPAQWRLAIVEALRLC
jgi:flagellar assembly protein FliH